MSLNGKKLSKRMLNALKTILYYQNRVRHDSILCVISTPNDTKLPCPRNSVATSKRSFHLHLFADSQTRTDVNSSLFKWDLQGVTWNFYSFERNRGKVDWIPNDHPSGISALIKLTLTTLLPYWVEKVIAMDTDVILNHDIAELWNHFYQFGEKQIVVDAWEQNSWSPTCIEPKVSTIPYLGRSGILFAFLWKRSQNCDHNHHWFRP
ncbi:hypothetical protein FGIG_05375 [Fasciola gigantica]|uniref:Uncharacterized protein n=1 Tax=Fasciola gigantica TaxID=46835 RepID=A0A504YK47_FASGI|nr:hypothetical protein FGIG_05375 [Fasciola gigantica]